MGRKQGVPVTGATKACRLRTTDPVGTATPLRPTTHFPHSVGTDSNLSLGTVSLTTPSRHLTGVRHGLGDDWELSVYVGRPLNRS